MGLTADVWLQRRRSGWLQGSHCKQSRGRLRTCASAKVKGGLSVCEELSHHAGVLQSPPLVAVSCTALGRGLVAQSDLQRGPILSVPIVNSLVIADDPLGGISVFSDRQQRAWQERNGEMPEQLTDFLQGEERWDARMAAWLLWLRKHPGKLWSSYLKLLPKEDEMCCLLNYQSAEEVEELQIGSLKREAEVQARWAAHLHWDMYAAAPSGGGGRSGGGGGGGRGRARSIAGGALASLKLSVDLSESLWAISMVRSRTFSDDVGGESLTLMVPYCDLANHGGDQQNSTFCVSRDRLSFELRALESIPAGQEALISYGDAKPNSMLLRDYGFVVPGNPHDRIDFGEAGKEGQQGPPADVAPGVLPPGVSGLNAAGLLQAAGFTGDLTEGQIEPVPAACSTSPGSSSSSSHTSSGRSAGGAAEGPAEEDSFCTAALTAARRRAALLSMPLSKPPAESEGGLFGWASARAWSSSGKPPPQPLMAGRVPSERAAAEALRRLLGERLSALPTCIEEDIQILARARAAAAAGSGTGGKARGAVGAAAAALTPRRETAVRARLEQKLLLREGVRVLEAYERELWGPTWSMVR